MAAGSEWGPATPTSGSLDWVHDICTDTVGALRRVSERGGDFVSYANGRALTLIAFAPEHNRRVLSDPETFNMVGPPGPRNSAQRRFALGLLGLNGPRHVYHRRLLMPALRRDAVAVSLTPVARIVEEHLGRWRVGQVIDLAQEMKDLSLELAGRVLFGLDEFSSARAIARVFQRWVDAYTAMHFALALPIPRPEGVYEGLLDYAAELERLFHDLIAQRRENLRHDHGDLLALLLHDHDRDQLSGDELIGEMHTLVNASYQTTSSALTWALFLLTQHPEIARRIADDPASTAPMPGPHSHLEHVIKEALRIFPPVIYTIRHAVRPATLGSLSVPQGTMVVLSIYVTHHNASLFPEPERFLPERWLSAWPSPYAYFPFGAGPRLCLGAPFAQPLLRVVLSAIMRRFRLSIVPGTRVDRHSGLTLGVRRGLPASVHPADGQYVATPVFGDVHEMVALPGAPPITRAA